VRRLVLSDEVLAEGPLRLPSDAAHYLRDVLRLDASVELELTDGAGRVARARIEHADKRSVVLNVSAPRFVPRPSRTLTLIQCVAKGEKMDQIVRQTTELGVSRIIPVISERAVARSMGRQDRWRQIVDDAVRVSGRAWRPELRPVTAFADLLAEPRASASWVFAIDGATAYAPSTSSDLEVLVGPEGGLSPAEVEAAREAGFTSVTLGEHTLRTETAAAAITALVMLAS
jgi:16S rRNA (uracil1498-N3)-methyltransferase